MHILLAARARALEFGIRLRAGDIETLAYRVLSLTQEGAPVYDMVDVYIMYITGTIDDFYGV